MGAATGIALASLAVVSAYQQAEAQTMQGEYQKSMFEMNVKLAGINAEDAITRGNEQASRLRSKGKSIAASQKAAFAAQGISTEGGSAEDVMAQTQMFNELDVMTVRNNAWREAWGYKNQAVEYGTKARFASMGARTESQASLLTGGLRALDYGTRKYE